MVDVPKKVSQTKSEVIKPVKIAPSIAAGPGKTTVTKQVNGRNIRVTASYAVVFILTAGVLLVGAYIAHKQTMQPWEVKIFRHINNMPNSLEVLGKIASIAKDSTWIAALAVVAAFVWRKWRLTWQLAVSILAGYMLTFGFKHFIHRPRPAELLTNVHLRWTDTGSGFPSGHVMVITIILLVLAPYLSKGWRWFAPFFCIGLVAWSRMYLGLHAPLDVIGGFAIGVGVVTFVRILPARLSSYLRINI